MNHNIIIDCGTNLCQGLNMMINKYKPDQDWFIYSFEPNPYAFSHSKKIINKCFNHLNIELINKAVWMKECTKKMKLELNDTNQIKSNIDKVIENNIGILNLYDKNNFFVGGSSNIMEENFNPRNPFVGDLKKEMIDVECIDFIKFISHNTKPEDKIYIKFDIEGAEYQVINALLKSNVLNRIKEITIEWHNHILFNKFDEPSLLKGLLEKGIILHPHQ
jgi:FkbM family methyltransferase